LLILSKSEREVLPITDLIWDAGGTLFDTYPAVVAACRAALQKLGHEASRAWLMDLFRQTTAHAFRVVSETFALDRDELTAAYKAAYEALGPESQPPFPFVREVCIFIHRSGGHNFIVTHRARESLEALLHSHGLAGYFSDWITKEDPFPRKPDPTSLLALMARHGLDADRCMAVGDRELDVLAGKRAGVKTCFFDPEGSPSHADLTVTSFDQLLRWLKARALSYRSQTTGGSQ
jgi:phosphoglycolate phosphatase-like HAD superfamily hydrolase